MRLLPFGSRPRGAATAETLQPACQGQAGQGAASEVDPFQAISSHVRAISAILELQDKRRIAVGSPGCVSKSSHSNGHRCPVGSSNVPWPRLRVSFRGRDSQQSEWFGIGADGGAGGGWRASGEARVHLKAPGRVKKLANVLAVWQVKAPGGVFGSSLGVSSFELNRLQRSAISTERKAVHLLARLGRRER